MKFNYTLAVLSGVALAASGASLIPSAVVGTIALYGAGILKGLPVADAREGRRKQFDQDIVRSRKDALTEL